MTNVSNYKVHFINIYLIFKLYVEQSDQCMKWMMFIKKWLDNFNLLMIRLVFY